MLINIMNYNICVPIPVKSLDISETALVLRKVLDHSPNLIELRFDYIQDVENITKTFIRRILSYIQPEVPTILTCREFSEGGHVRIAQHKRIEILKLLIDAKPKFIDIEINTPKDILGKIIDLASEKEVKLIFSYHDFEKTPTYVGANNLIDDFFEKLIVEMGVDTKIVEQSILKLIFTARTFKENFIPLKLCKFISSKKQKFISFCMGDLGFFSRFLCVFSGSIFTYGSFEEQTAPGQMNIAEMREILKLMNFKV